MKKHLAIGRAMAVSLATTALTMPGFVHAGPGCMNPPRMGPGYHPYNPMAAQAAYGPAAPYARPAGPVAYPMWMASPYNRPVSARPGQVVVTARPVAKTALENKTAETSLAAVARDAGPGAETVTVRIKGMRFEPVNVTVKPGTTVTWIQEDRMPHTITGQGNGLRSSTLYGGQEYSHTFTEAGSYEYRCGLHPSMKGSIVVGETGKDT